MSWHGLKKAVNRASTSVSTLVNDPPHSTSRLTPPLLWGAPSLGYDENRSC